LGRSGQFLSFFFNFPRRCVCTVVDFGRVGWMKIQVSASSSPWPPSSRGQRISPWYLDALRELRRPDGLRDLREARSHIGQPDAQQDGTPAVGLYRISGQPTRLKHFARDLLVPLDAFAQVVDRDEQSELAVRSQAAIRDAHASFYGPHEFRLLLLFRSSSSPPDSDSSFTSSSLPPLLLSSSDSDFSPSPLDSSSSSSLDSPSLGPVINSPRWRPLVFSSAGSCGSYPPPPPRDRAARRPTSSGWDPSPPRSSGTRARPGRRTRV